MIAAYAMRGRMQAVMLAALFAVLAMLLPPLLIIGSAVVGLVTLRLGARRGLEVMAGGVVVAALAGVILLHDPALGLASLLFWLPVLMLGLLLRYSVSLSFTVQVALIIGLLPPLLEWIFLSSHGGNWLHLLDPLRQALTESKMLEPEQVTEVMNWLSIWLGAFMAGGLFLQVCLGLFLARSWQAKLYNPGGFRQEFQALRVTRPLIFLATVIGLLMLFGSGSQWSLVRILAVLLMLLLFFQGLAVLHSLLSRSRAGEAWLLGVYALLLFALPYMSVAVAATGYADAWLDFRKLDSQGRKDDSGEAGEDE